MSELERAFITTAEKTYKKVTDKNGVTRYFKDGTPIKQNAWNAAQGHLKYEGEKVNVAVPSDKGGPGYERKEVSPLDASALGKELRLTRDDVPGQSRDTVTLGGEDYSTKDLAELNERITERHGADAVMKY